MNIILGDINPKNLMIDDRKSVFIIDADSWQLEGYPCPVGTPMYTSPTMLGEDLLGRSAEYGGRAVCSRDDAVPDRHDGTIPLHAHRHDGDMVQLIKEGNFAFQYENRNNKDQPDGDWKFIWSHIHKPVKDLFWHTFHRRASATSSVRRAAEWLEAFKAYKAYLGNKRLNFDPMSNDVRPIRNKAFRPDTPIEDYLNRWSQSTRSLVSGTTTRRSTSSQGSATSAAMPSRPGPPLPGQLLPAPPRRRPLLARTAARVSPEHSSHTADALHAQRRRTRWTRTGCATTAASRSSPMTTSAGSRAVSWTCLSRTPRSSRPARPRRARLRPSRAPSPSSGFWARFKKWLQGN